MAKYHVQAMLISTGTYLVGLKLPCKFVQVQDFGWVSGLILHFRPEYVLQNSGQSELQSIPSI